jgi:phosphoribosylaminoimidazole (AIR) synthetase
VTPRIERKEVTSMVKCGICGGEAPRQPGITDEGTCDLCGKKVMLADDCLQKKAKKE